MGPAVSEMRSERSSLVLCPLLPKPALGFSLEGGSSGWHKWFATYQETTGLGSPCTRMLIMTSCPSLTDWSMSET